MPPALTDDGESGAVGENVTPIQNQNNLKPEFKDLPTYEEAINPNAPPPTYDSLFGRVVEAHQRAANVPRFLKTVADGGVGVSLLFLAFQFIPCGLFYIGTYFLFECPAGQYIPVFLLVMGLFGIMKQLLYFSAIVRKTAAEVAAERQRQTLSQKLLDCFILCWFIIGSIWVYEIYEPSYDPKDDVYCNEYLYLFAYWLTTSVYVAFGITFCLCLVSAVLVCKKSGPEVELPPA